MRRYHFEPGWGRDFQAHGGVYDNEWSVMFWDPCATYQGQTMGDSGGALIDAGGRLCGVLSGISPGWPIPFGEVLVNNAAAVDSSETIARLSTSAMNSNLHPPRAG